MIKLKNVSKFYYSKGVVASGISKVNLEFKMGEFVAITGESGSGKSTLLNVISGLDTYEEGEMYINGLETSHYGEADFENYRRKYIGNIFQNFNLVNSYTVYQNIELVLLFNGQNKKEIKPKVLELIKKVDLYKFRNTKVSKLSGGQKQRVAIARALAKETPIIIADEPTGNLDSKAAVSILKLLNEISKDKLVIVVTHNYEQIENYVTRKIKMHDGKVLEDKEIKKLETDKIGEAPTIKNISILNRLRLGLRNTFNIIPKFLLLFLVYLFITVAVISSYSSFKEQEYIENKSGYNDIFSNSNNKRVVLKKNDKTSFTEADYEKINSLDNISYIMQNDLLLDTWINFTDEESIYIDGTADNIENFDGVLDKGRMPENEYEIVVYGNKGDYYLNANAERTMNTDIYLRNMYNGERGKQPIKVVGIKYRNDNQYSNTLYLSSKMLDELSFQTNQQYSTIKVLFKDKYYESNAYMTSFKLQPNSLVQDGTTLIASDLNYLCKNDNCINEHLVIELNNIYYNDTLDLVVNKTYTKKDFKAQTGIEDYDMNNGTVYVSVNDYNRLFNKGNYQSSIFVKNINNIDTTTKKLNDLGYTTLAIKDTLVTSNSSQVIKIISAVIMITLIITLFFISYFVIRIILKSRNVYFSTIRMLGSTMKISKQLLIIELLTVSNLAYFSFLGFIYINKLNNLNIKFVDTILTYLKFNDYLILYIVLILMSYFISLKFAKNLFKKSAISTMTEEV